MIFTFIKKQTQFVAKIRWCLFVAVATILILFVILMGLLRLALPYLTTYEKEIEAQLQAALNLPVEISRIDAGWHWFSPQLKLMGVNVYSDQDKSLLVGIDEVVFEFDVIDSIVGFELDPSVVILKGTSLSIERNKKGAFSVQGLLLDGEEADKTKSVDFKSVLALLNGKKLRLQDATITWSDAIHNIPEYVFEKTNVVIQVGDARYKMSIETDVPRIIGKRIQLIADVSLDEDEWLSETYINAKDINIASLESYIAIPNIAVSSKLNAKLWLDFKGMELKSVAGSFHAMDFEVVFNNSLVERTWSSKNLSSDFQVENINGEWDIVVDDLNVRMKDSNWEDVYFSLKYKEDDNSLDAHFDYLGLSDLAHVFSNFPVASSWHSLMSEINPKGELRKTKIHISDWKQPSSWFLKTSFSNLGLTVPGEGIRLDGISGKLDIGNNTGSLLLDSQKLRIKSKYFNKPLMFDQLAADIELQKSKNVYFLSTDSIIGIVDGVGVESRVKYETGEGGFLDMQLRFDGANVGWFNRHRTDELLGEDVAAWLSESLIAGDLKTADFMFHGKINDFPFRGNEGVIQSIVEADNGVLKYQPDWPGIKNIKARFLLDNESIVVDKATGYINNSFISNSVTAINLAGNSHVKISGSVETNAKDVERFFKATPLKNDYLDLVQYTEIEGALKTNLNIDVPLDDNNDVNVSGDVVLNNNRLKVKDFGYTIKDANGVVEFNNALISSKRLSGSFNKSKAIAILDTVDAGSGLETILKADLKSDVASLLPAGWKMKNLSAGKADWQLELGFNHSSTLTGEVMSVKLESNLMGAALNLPAPFFKNKNKSSGFILGLNVLELSTSLLVQYDDTLDLSMQWDDDFESLKSDIQVLNGSVKELNSGVNVTANIKQLNLNKWEKVISSLSLEPSDKKTFASTVNLSINTNQLQYGEYKLNKVALKASLDDDWFVDVLSDEVVGNIKIPKYDNPLEMNFEKLDLSSILKAEATKKSKVILFSPKDIPALKVQAKNFTYKGYAFNDMNLVTSHTPYGLTVHALDVKGEGVALKVKGSWFSRKNTADNSNFRIEIESDNVGRMLSFYKFTDSVKEGEGKAVVDWQWAASPLDFDWKLVSGRMQINIEDGSFVDIEPGAGRLLGMFSFSALPKRFVLNFSDTFTKGYEFNNFTSHANFSQGNLYTNNTELTGHAADVYFRGRIGLADKDYDQVMSVVPRISSGVSGWIAVAQGAVVGLTAYVAQKLLGVDEAAKNQYHITGSWSDPVIKKVGDDVEVSNSDANVKEE